MCIFILKSVIKYYTQQRTLVYSCFLDASKAFDRVNHWKLFNKLIIRKAPLLIVRILIFWYSNQKMCINGANLHLAFSLFQIVKGKVVFCLLDYLLYTLKMSINLQLSDFRSGYFIGHQME